MATRDGFAGPGGEALVLTVSEEGHALTIPDAHFLFTADYDRDGSDLILSKDGSQTIIVEGYFAAASPVDLASPEGGMVWASVVKSLAGPLAPGQYAQAGTPAGAAPIGKVETLEGAATAQRTDGTKVDLKIGDPVFQGDVVETASGSKLGITFIDQSVFALSDEARMVLDELVYSPGGQDNSMLVNLVQGTFVFVAGQVAPTGDMKVQTPVATMGIRGTTLITKVSAVDGTTTTSLDLDPDGSSGRYQIIDTATNTVLAEVVATGENWVITPTAPGLPPDITTTPKNEDDLFLDQQALAFLYQTYSSAASSFETSPNGDGNNGPQGGSNNSVPGSGIDSGVDPNALDPLNPGNVPNEPIADPLDVPDPVDEPPQSQPDANPDQSQAPREAPTSEGTFVSTDEDTTSDGIEVPVGGTQPGDVVEVTITELPERGLLLLDGAEVAVGDTFPLEQTELLTFSPNGEFEELTAQDLELLQFSYTVGLENGPTSEPVVAIVSVPGVNDDPIAVDETAEGGENQVLTIDVLANDTDVDRNDDPSNFILTEASIVPVEQEQEIGLEFVLEGEGFESTASVSIVNNQLQFDPGSDFDFLGVNESAQVRVQYTMTDDEGAASSAEVLITVNGQNDDPLALNDTAAGQENQVLAIDVLANDTDPDNSDGPSNFSLTQASIVTDNEAFEVGGSVSIVSNQLQFDPGTDFDFLGAGESAQVLVEYTMADGAGGQSSAEVLITVNGQNDGPMAVDDEASGGENEVLTIDVLANDTDPDGEDPDDFTITEASIVVDGEEVEIGASVSIVNDKLQFNPGQDFNFLGTGESAQVVVQYTMADGAGAQSSAEVLITLNGVNDGPTAVDDTANVGENQILNLDVLANDFDPDSSDNPGNFILTQANILVDIEEYELEGEFGEVGGMGTVSIVDNQLRFDPGSDFDFLGSGESAQVTVQYTMTDDEGAASNAEALITVNGVNDAPTPADDTATGNENQVLNIDVLANDTDPDASDFSGNFILTEAEIVTDNEAFAVGGSVSIVNGQVQFDPGTAFDFLATGESVQVLVRYTMTDNENVPATADVVITVTGLNDGPMAVNDTESVGENQPPLAIDVLANDTDPDGNDGPTNFVLTQATILSVTGALLATANVTIANDQVVFDPGTDFDALAVGDSAQVLVEYTMADNEGLPSTGQLLITVNGENDGPVAKAQIVETNKETQATGQLLAEDVDIGDELTFDETTSATANGFVTIDEDGSFTYTPDEGFQGFDSFQFTVRDASGASSVGTVTVEVATEDFTAPDGQTISFGINGDGPLSSGIGIANVEIDVSEVSGSAINVSFVFDASGSLGQTDYTFQMNAIQAAINEMRAQFAGSQTQVDVQLVRFATEVDTEERDLFDPDLDDVEELLGYTGGFTNFDDALFAAKSFFDGEAPSETNFLFFTSDGQPFGSSTASPPNPPWQTTAQNLKDAGVIISAFGIGTGVTEATLNQIDNTGGSENVATASGLLEAFSTTPIFAAELTDFSLNLAVDGGAPVEIATQADLQPDGVNSDLPLADVPGIADLLGEQNQFTATATFDFDGDLGTTDDQITLFSAETISASEDPVTKTGTSGNDLLLGGVQDDTIDGAGGADILLGFAGNDRLEVSDDTFRRVDGGEGQDILVLDNTSLDFTNISSTKYRDIEAIEFKGAGAHTLTLDLDAVEQLSSGVNEELDAILETLLGPAGKPEHSLVIDSDTPNNDTVALISDEGGSWELLSDTAFQGYDIYGYQSESSTVLAAVAIADDVLEPPPA